MNTQAPHNFNIQLLGGGGGSDQTFEFNVLLEVGQAIESEQTFEYTAWSLSDITDFKYVRTNSNNGHSFTFS